MKVRFLRPGEVLPIQLPNESLVAYVARHNGGTTNIVGGIGYGAKTHIFKAHYINLNGENVICSYYSICGTETYKTRGIIGYGFDTHTATCKKCKNRLS